MLENFRWAPKNGNEGKTKKVDEKNKQIKRYILENEEIYKGNVLILRVRDSESG